MIKKTKNVGLATGRGIKAAAVHTGRVVKNNRREMGVVLLSILGFSALLWIVGWLEPGATVPTLGNFLALATKMCLIGVAGVGIWLFIWAFLPSFHSWMLLYGFETDWMALTPLQRILIFLGVCGGLLLMLFLL